MYLTVPKSLHDKLGQKAFFINWLDELPSEIYQQAVEYQWKVENLISNEEESEMIEDVEVTPELPIEGEI